MSSSSTEERFRLKTSLPEYFGKIQDLCKRVYPFYRPWSFDELESHRSYFPDGQLIVIDTETDKVVGLAFSLIIAWNDYSPQDSWLDFTSGGFFHNHDPKKGKTLYGAEVMVDPDYRGMGIGKLLYAGRREIVFNYGLKRIRAGARIRGYFKHKDQLSPQEYVRKVIKKEIFDPTLSFQLGQGFQVIDVSSNYILNDPESLGFAAVIEWLNPYEVTSAELKKNQQVVQRFLTEEKFISEFLPKELRRLVRKASTTLGQTISEVEGENFLKKIEYYREALKKTRNQDKKLNQLKLILKKLEKEPESIQIILAKAFSVQLELVNVCEAVYRSWKLRQKASPIGLYKKVDLTYVLTAHPTEARSPQVIKILEKIQVLLSDSVHSKFPIDEAELATLIKLLWIQPLGKTEGPTVVDEAESIFSLSFSDKIIDFILSNTPGHELNLSTWVGGDKDGHPGVDEKVMKDCLKISRHHILQILRKKLSKIVQDFAQFLNTDKKIKNSILLLENLITETKKFDQIGHGDGTKIKIWKSKFNSYYKKSPELIQQHYLVVQIQKLLTLFPALVMPIELREDASLIKDALTNSKSTIRRMLIEIQKIAGANNITHYTKNFVISHCESPEDLNNACKLVDKTCHRPILPITPLFESRSALKNCNKILSDWLAKERGSDRVYRFWSNRLEIMLGYSDSSKQIGVLPSRLLILKSMKKIERTLQKFQITPIFFHGSGGSVARGGGSIKEQVSWWSHSAVASPKMTIQGEMIQRLFASKEILNSQSSHITRESLKRKTNKIKHKRNKILEKFSSDVEANYSNLIQNQTMLTCLLDSTPYRYLDVMKIGSRPNKRPDSTIDPNSLRAIPWILCWTQTRTLLPSWWGIGSAWKNCSSDEKLALKKSISGDSFLSSFVKTLGFTLEKVELDIWELYLTREGKSYCDVIRTEFKEAKNFVYEITDSKELLTHRPWMKESIYLRSPHIHILNLLQIIAIKKSHEVLLRETIVGIACGMLTTG